MVEKELAQNLLERGDKLELVDGRLLIKPISGEVVPDSWLNDNRACLVDSIIIHLGINAYLYDGYSTGRYGKSYSAGVCLQFVNLLTGETAYTIFNAELDRQRNSVNGKKGGPLPGKQFRVGKRHAFYKFWVRSGLSLPPRLSSFHDYMGKLSGVVFSAHKTKGERLDCKSLAPLNVTYQKVLESFGLTGQTYKGRACAGQYPDSEHTESPDKSSPEPQLSQGFESISATSDINYGLRSQGGAVSGGVVIPITGSKKPVDQTTEEWLADYAK